MGQRVPVRGALGGQGEDVLAEADPLGLIRIDRLVHLDHGAGRIDAALDEPRLDPLRLRQGQPEGEALPVDDRGGATAPGRVVDQVEGPELVLGTPPPPVAHPGRHLGEYGRDGHARVPYRRARLVVPNRAGGDTEGANWIARNLREGLPMTTMRAAVCTGLNEPWKTEEIEIDPPGNREVRVKMVWSGMCHSDEHLRDGDISQTPEVLEMMGVKSMFPVVGGHEGPAS